MGSQPQLDYTARRAQAKDTAAAVLGTLAAHLSEEQSFQRRGVRREFTPLNLIPTREEELEGELE